MVEQVYITIDEKHVQACIDDTILNVARRCGIDIPTLCHHPELKPYTACFICVVEVVGSGKLIPACSTKVYEGLSVMTNSDRVRASRKVCIELLLSDHVGDCKGPCQITCPAGIDIPGFISLLSEKNDAESLRLIKQAVPFPASLGRICPKPCESQCKRSCVDEAVSICFLKRYVADTDLQSEHPYIPNIGNDTHKRIAIIGAGPAGLTAAFYLRQYGHQVSIYDAHEEPGGMLRYGIPAYRLPRDILAKEISIIEKMGAEIKCNQRLGTDIHLSNLRVQHDAVFIAIGAQNASDMRIDGEDAGGVVSGIAFLEEIARLESQPKALNDMQVGDHVIVVGGGNTAIDAARTAIRLNAKKVTVLYRRTRDEMPADSVEIDAAMHEGIHFSFLSAPLSLDISDAGVVLHCIQMKLGEPDASGRKRPEKIRGSDYSLSASLIISAIGQSVDSDCVDASENSIDISRWHTLEINKHTFQTQCQDVFAAGDCVSGADNAISAIAAGRKVAVSIHQFVSGEQVKGEPKGYLHSMAENPSDNPSELKTLIQSSQSQRQSMPEEDAKTRIHHFKEVELGYDANQAEDEGERCLACGCRSFQSCKIHQIADDYNAKPERFSGSTRTFYIDDSHPLIQYESHKCIMCGSCVRMCKEVKGLHVLDYVGRGFDSVIMPSLGMSWKESNCDACLKCIPVCPTGAISLKTSPAKEILSQKNSHVDASKCIDTHIISNPPKEKKQ